MSNPIPEMLKLAEKTARQFHAGQYRRDGITPYIKHVEDVVERLHTPEEKIVGFCHDLLEDTPVTAKDLLNIEIDEKLVDAVVLLTKTPGYDYNEYMRKIKSNPLARAVKLADMRANMADTPTKNQVKRYLDGILYLLS